MPADAHHVRGRRTLESKSAVLRELIDIPEHLDLLLGRQREVK